MKNAVAYIKAHKSTIIKTTLVAAATVTAIALTGYAIRNAEVVAEAAELVAE